MSIEVLLIPVALGVAAWQARKDSTADAKVLQISTRLKDPRLLGESLTALGARVEQADEITTACWPEVTVSFTPGEDGILHAYCKDPGKEDLVLERISELDRTYARLVQRNLVDRVRAQADSMGMRLESQVVNDDDSVSLSLEVLR